MFSVGKLFGRVKVKVKSQLFGVAQRTLLVCVSATHFAQPQVHDMRHGVVWNNAATVLGIYCAAHTLADGDLAFANGTLMKDVWPILSALADRQGSDAAKVTHLTTLLSIEGCRIEDDSHDRTRACLLEKFTSIKDGLDGRAIKGRAVRLSILWRISPWDRRTLIPEPLSLPPPER